MRELRNEMETEHNENNVKCPSCWLEWDDWHELSDSWEEECDCGKIVHWESEVSRTFYCTIK